MGEPRRYTGCRSRPERTDRRTVARGWPADASATRSRPRRTAVFERKTGTGARAQGLARRSRARRIAGLSGASRRRARQTRGTVATRQSAGQHGQDHLRTAAGWHRTSGAVASASRRGVGRRRRGQRARYCARAEAAAHPGRRRIGGGVCAVRQPQDRTRGLRSARRR